jgi:hypothetical protein
MRALRAMIGTETACRFAAAIVLLGPVAPAYAYVDPGTGSMLIQLVFASVAGAIFFLRDLRHRILSWFAKWRDRSAEPEE